MFNAITYIERRKELKKNFKKGILLFLSNEESPMNYADNTYHFRQDSTFLYYWGIKEPGFAAVINMEKDEDIIFGEDRSIDEIVWMGFGESVKDKAQKVGVEEIKSYSKLNDYLNKHINKSVEIHFIPQYRQANLAMLEKLLGINHNRINEYSSKKMIKSIIKQRSIKSKEEVNEISKAVDISYEMNTAAMRLITPGIVEREVFGKIEGIALSKGDGVSFPIIFSVNGQILHNHSHENIMKDGQIAVLDSGAQTTLGYASDITRTIPVNGVFSEKQKEIYNIVLASQIKSIEMIKPGIKFKDIHLEAARTTANGLRDLGIMKGDINEAVEKGAHALFFPHGLGHMIGLDVHDLENYGENFVGYSKSIKRSDQFGLAYLRLGKQLKEGNVVTVEPGCYFIPALIEKWQNEGKHTEFINYEKLGDYLDFGGVRIEDDVLVTENGFEILGKAIPKTIDEVQEACTK